MRIFFWFFLLLMNRVEARDIDVAGCPHKHTDMRYRAISGQKFAVSCDLLAEDPASIFNSSRLYESQVQWYQQSSNGGVTELLHKATTNLTLQGNFLWFNPITVQDSGTYICMNREKKWPCLNIFIAVQTKEVAHCSGDIVSNRYLLVEQGASIACPGKNCYSNLQRSSVKWYKNGIKVRLRKDIRPSLQFKHDKIVLHSVYAKDNGTYICDYMMIDNNTQWRMRTVVDVTIISKDTMNPPKVLDPSDVRTLEVEPGQLLELECKAQFGFEMKASSLMQWFRKNSKRKQLLQEKWVHPKGLEGQIFSHIFKLTKVTEEDLSSHFICLAQNSIGNSTGMFKLRRTNKAVPFLVTLSCTVIILFGVISGGVLIYWRWIELVLFYRNYLASAETLYDSKEFDAFVSYAKPDSPEADQALYNEEQFALEFLPQVLENEYGYKLCLSERDILPGGAYTDDIVTAVKKSRRAIMILSPSYFKNSLALFELKAAVNTMLEDKTIKLILIQFEPFQEPQSLPHKVKKALKILPRITWKSATSPAANKPFWKKLRYYMPVKHSKGAQGEWLSFPPCPCRLQSRNDRKATGERRS
ncbi:interleukin-18 receptor accessory protein [Elgaria multicarinata webbii]|uniref:interleukin-18 receptor accessory protein n=1 Tax=Elgaria multicarinata webbii TaxID=159646 RepID=UPI002FCD5C2C